MKALKPFLLLSVLCALFACSASKQLSKNLKANEANWLLTITDKMIFLNNRPVVPTDEVRNISQTDTVSIRQLKESLQETMDTEDKAAQIQIIVQVEQNISFHVLFKVMQTIGNTIDLSYLNRVALTTYGESTDDNMLRRRTINFPDRGTPKKARDDNRLFLTAIITDSVVTLGAKGGFLPSLFYAEYHQFVTEDGIDTLIKHTPGGGMPIHPNGREFTIQELKKIHLYVVNFVDWWGRQNDTIARAMYTQSGEMLLDADRVPLHKINIGDTIFTLTNPRKQIIVSNLADFELRPLSVYDMFRNNLIRIKERYGDEVDDADDIIIAAECEVEVALGKIIPLIDIARDVGFTNVSIAGLLPPRDAGGTRDTVSGSSKKSDDIKSDVDKVPPINDISKRSNDSLGASLAHGRGRSRASIQNVVMQNVPILRGIYNEHLRANPELVGRILVKFAINESGEVFFIHPILESTVNDPEFEQAILEHLKTWNFGAIDQPGDVTEVTYPFIFSQ